MMRSLLEHYLLIARLRHMPASACLPAHAPAPDHLLHVKEGGKLTFVTKTEESIQAKWQFVEEAMLG